MLGYWKDPNNTPSKLREAAFIPETSHIRIRILSLGTRIKDTVRKSGENISTTEVESVLIEHELIENACMYCS